MLLIYTNILFFFFLSSTLFSVLLLQGAFVNTATFMEYSRWQNRSGTIINIVFPIKWGTCCAQLFPVSSEDKITENTSNFFLPLEKAFQEKTAHAVTLVLKPDWDSHKNKQCYWAREKSCFVLNIFPFICQNATASSNFLCISLKQCCQQWLLQSFVRIWDFVPSLYKLVLFLFACIWITGLCSAENSNIPLNASLHWSDTEIFKK